MMANARQIGTFTAAVARHIVASGIQVPDYLAWERWCRAASEAAAGNDVPAGTEAHVRAAIEAARCEISAPAQLQQAA
jgi:hypothetical protein